MEGLQALDVSDLAERTPLYTPADIKAVSDIALRTAVFRAVETAAPGLVMDDLLGVLRSHQRAIRPDAARGWIEESRQELGPLDESLLRARILPPSRVPAPGQQLPLTPARSLLPLGQPQGQPQGQLPGAAPAPSRRASKPPIGGPK